MFVNFSNHFKYFYLFIFIILINCQLKESSNTHGILFLENRSNKLNVNKSNKNDVISIIGQPHSKSINNENEWFYIERIFVKGEYHKLGQNILKTNNVLLLKFNKYGILESKELIGKDGKNKVTFSKSMTENELTKKSFVEKFLSSLRNKMYGNK